MVNLGTLFPHNSLKKKTYEEAKLSVQKSNAYSANMH